MALILEPIAIPLEANEKGELWVSGTRIPLQYLVYEYRAGATAEDIVARYPTLKLSDVHALLSFYLANQTEVDRYVDEREALAGEWEQKIKARFPQQGLREKLLAREAQKQQ
jgi:uncharacterized protein (DUF433 family)